MQIFLHQTFNEREAAEENPCLSIYKFHGGHGKIKGFQGVARFGELYLNKEIPGPPKSENQWRVK